METASYSAILVESNESSNNGNQTKVIKESTFKVTVLGVDISWLSQTAQFVLVSAGVFFFFIIYGYLLVCSTDIKKSN